MSHCPYCNKKIAMSKAFCSKTCKENYFQLVAIQVPKLFLRRLYQKCTAEQREEEIVKFAKRHGWRADLLSNKVKELALEQGYISKEDVND
jgi:hypothetical protein